MRNGNCKLSHNAVWNSLFLSYLWGMETLLLSTPRLLSLRVLILPMRNGNYSGYFDGKNIFFVFLSYLWGMETLREITLPFLCLLCSYPTYEEWKLPSKKFSIIKPSLFLSYLWGMETFIITFIVFIHVLVLILPMRNGNKNYTWI